MAERPAIFVTRKLPDAVTARLLHDYRATLNPEDGPISGPALAAGAVGHDALLISSRESMDGGDAGRAAELDSRHRHLFRRIRAYRSAGRESARPRRHQHAGRADRRHRRHRHAADPRAPPAVPGEGERMVRNDRWAGLGLAEMLGLQVSGKRLGISGMGRDRPRARPARARLRHGPSTIATASG